MKSRCKAIYLCERCWSNLSVDIEPVDTGRGQKEIFIQQMIFHDCPGGGKGRVLFVGSVEEKGGYLPSDEEK